MDHHDLGSLSRPLNSTEIELLTQLDRLKFFLATAPSRWSSASSSASSSNNAPGSGSSSASHNNNNNLTNGASAAPSSHPALNRFLLPSGEFVSCVLWSGLYHITGTDIVRALVFRFEAFGRPVTNMKKFEEGVFSDLRNLKPGTDACLEEPKSPFLDLLFKYQCIRTQKKQKVFYWFSVPHDRLFLDALERDLKREKMGQEPTTVTRGEPALSFKYDPKRTLYEQFLKSVASAEGNGDDGDDDASPTTASFNLHGAVPSGSQRPVPRMNNSLSVVSPADIISRRLGTSQGVYTKQEEDESMLSPTQSQMTSGKQPFLSMFSLFEGSPTYKQRRKKASGKAASAHIANARRVSSLASLSGAVRTAGSSGSASNVPSRRSSMLSMGSSELGSMQHPSLVSHQYHDISAPGSRPQSQHQHLHPHQPLGSYGLSMNPHVERKGEDNDYNRRPSLPNSDDGSHGQQQPSTQMVKAFACPLYSCQVLFHRSEHLKKHMRVHAMRQVVRPHNSASLIYPCDRGCGKVFSRADNLRLHQTGCRGLASAGSLALGELTESEVALEKEDALAEDAAAHMEFDGDVQEIEVPSNSNFEDDPYGQYAHANSASPPPSMTPSSVNGHNQHLALHTDAARLHGPRSDGISTPQYGVGTSAENSPYVETPEGGAAQWANLPNGHNRLPQPLQFHNHRLAPITIKPIHPLHHQMSHHNLGMTSPPGSAHSSTHGSAFTQQQSLHPQSTRYQSPASEIGAYNSQGFAHPSSAPSHKATFDHASLYPPTYPTGMMGLSLRRHRSATPMIGGGGGSGVRIGGNGVNEHSLVQQAHLAGLDSRPASSAGGESNYGSVIASSAHPFAYSIDSGDGRGSAMGYVPPGSGMTGTGLASTVNGVSRPASTHSSSPGAPYGAGEYETSGSPYDGSNGSPPSAGHTMTGLTMNAHPHEQAHPMVGMPGHTHSLSSEIATQQMQQYVDFDGMAESGASSTEGHGHGQYASASTAAYPHSHSYQQGQGHVQNEMSEAQQQSQYAEAQRYPQAHGDIGTYHSTGSENGSHEEMYSYQHYPQQHHASIHVPHHMNYGYPPEVGAAQQVAL